jgi:hypothetical protein
MDDPTDIRLPRIAPLLLAGVLVGLAITRPGNLAGDAPAYRLLTGLTAVAAVGYVAWRFHGLIPAAGAITLFLYADSTSRLYTAFLERGADAVLLATLALGLGAGSRQGRPGTAAWAVLAALAVGIAYFGWFGRELPTPVDPVARDRIRHVTVGLAGLTVLVGLMARGAGWRDRLRLIGVAVFIPAAGIVAAQLVSGEWPRLVDGGEWDAVIPEWQVAVHNGEWHAAAWCWTTPWVAGPLILVGLWRTVARGRNGLRKGRPPLAWLLTAAGIGTILAVGARGVVSDSLALAAVGAILSVFGVADLVLALIERIELKPPEPGPPAVSRVR